MVIFVHRTVPRGAVQMNKTEEQIRDIFKKADRDGDGRLSKEELKQAFRQLGAHVPEWRVLRCFQHVDANKDGLILIAGTEFDELIKYALSKYGYKF